MKTLVPNYTLSGNTVTLGGVNTPLDHLLFISDATTGQLLYSPAGPTLSGYSTIAGNKAVATLSVSPSADTDLLTIYYDNGVNPVNAPSTVTVGGGSIGVNFIPSISGTVTLGAGTANIGNVNSDASGTGNVTTSAPLVITTTNFGTLAFQSNNAATGTVTIEGSVTGSDPWTATTYVALTTGNSSSNFAANTSTIGQINTSGLAAIRFRSNTISGTVGITYNLSRNVSNVMLDNALPSGSNVIGKVGFDSLNNGVTIGNTVTVSGSLTAYGSDSLGTLHQLRTDSSGDLITARTWNLAQGTDTVYASLGNQSLAVTGSFYQATQPVSGSLSGVTLSGSSGVTLPVSIASDNASPFNVTLSSVGSGVTLPVSGFPSVQNVSLVGDSLTAIGTSLSAGPGTASSLPAYASITSLPANAAVSLSAALPTGTNTLGYVSLASAQTLTAFAATSGITNTGATIASTASGGVSVVAGSSCTKMLTVQNTGTLNNLYFYCNNTSLNATANGLQLAPGQGYQFSVLPSSSQYLYLQGNTAYALMYA
jgi:hypothetical protein